MILRVRNAPAFENVQTLFLDRDGVLNRKAREGEYISRWEQLEVLPGAARAVSLLNRNGLPVYVVSNQRGVALGLYSVEDVHALHRRLNEELAKTGAHIDGFFFCPHDKACCDCRKPLPGLFEQARAAHPEIKFTTSIMIGDSLSDIEAGVRLGMRTIFIEGEPDRQKGGAAQARDAADAVYRSLAEAVAALLTARAV